MIIDSDLTIYRYPLTTIPQEDNFSLTLTLGVVLIWLLMVDLCLSQSKKKNTEILNSIIFKWLVINVFIYLKYIININIVRLVLCLIQSIILNFL